MNQTTIEELQNLLDGKVINGHKMIDNDLENTLDYLSRIGIVEYDKIRIAYSINPNNSDSSKHLQKFIELNNLDKFKKYYINYNPNKKSYTKEILIGIFISVAGAILFYFIQKLF